MNTRAAVRISLGLGLAALIPVLLVVVLGVYGESLGGRSSPAASPAATLSVSPQTAKPGATLRLEGAGWPPRRQVRIDLVRLTAGGGEPAPPIRIGGAIASPGGGFAAEVVLPASLPLATGAPVLIRVAAATESGEGVQASAAITVQGFDNELIVVAVDLLTRAPLAQARVELRDKFGALIAGADTEADGAVRLQGLLPGAGYTVSVRLPDRRVTRFQAVEISESGSKLIEAELAGSIGERFYVGGQVVAGEDAIDLIGVDMAAELAVKERVRLEPWAHRNDQVAGVYQRRSVFFDTRATLAGVYGPAANEPLPAELALALSALQVSDPLGVSGVAFEPSAFRYLGRAPGSGDLLVSVATGSNVALFHIDPQRGLTRRTFPIYGAFLGPVLTPAGDKAVLFEWEKGLVIELDLATGATTQSEALGAASAVVMTMDGRGAVYLFSEPGGRIYRIDLQAEPLLIAALPELSNNIAVMEPDPAGDRLLLASADDRLVYVVETESGKTAYMAPIQGKVEQILFAADGKRVFLASPEVWAVFVYSWPELQLLNTISLDADSRPY